MPRPSDQTLEERRAEGQRLASELQAANHEDAYLFSEQAALFASDEEELRLTLPDDEVESILAYRRARQATWETATVALILENLLERARDGELHSRMRPAERDELKNQLTSKANRGSAEIAGTLLMSQIDWLAREAAQALESPLGSQRAGGDDAPPAHRDLAELVHELAALL